METNTNPQKSARIVAFLNTKGGVGKTTSTFAVGAALAALGRRTLLVDMDAQCSLTLSVGINDKVSFSTFDIMTRDRSKEPKIIKCPQDPGGNLWVIPCDMMLALSDLTLAGMVQRETILKKFLDKLRGQFDYILIDCPPALGIINTNTLLAADTLIVPIIPEPLSVQGLRVLQAGIDYLNTMDLGVTLEIDGLLVNRLDSRTSLHKNLETGLRLEFGEKVFRTVVHENIDVSKAPGVNQSIYQFNRSSQGAADYFAFTQEFLKRYEK